MVANEVLFDGREYEVIRPGHLPELRSLIPKFEYFLLFRHSFLVRSLAKERTQLIDNPSLIFFSQGGINWQA